jgi:sucrose-6-phosphatase
MISPTHEALERAVESLRRNITPMGFSAAGLNDNPLTDNDSNYFAVWSRDGSRPASGASASTTPKSPTASAAPWN